MDAFYAPAEYWVLIFKAEQGRPGSVGADKETDHQRALDTRQEGLSGPWGQVGVFNSL